MTIYILIDKIGIKDDKKIISTISKIIKNNPSSIFLVGIGNSTISKIIKNKPYSIFLAGIGNKYWLSFFCHMIEESVASNNDNIFISVLRGKDQGLSKIINNVFENAKIKIPENYHSKTRLRLINLNSKTIITPKIIKILLKQCVTIKNKKGNKNGKYN